MIHTKDDPCICELRSLFGHHVSHVRTELDISQMAFAEELNIERRSYVELEHCDSLCSALTLLRYLCYYCDDPIAFLAQCKLIQDKYLPPPRFHI